MLTPQSVSHLNFEIVPTNLKAAIKTIKPFVVTNTSHQSIVYSQSHIKWSASGYVDDVPLRLFKKPNIYKQKLKKNKIKITDLYVSLASHQDKPYNVFIFTPETELFFIWQNDHSGHMAQ